MNVLVVGAAGKTSESVVKQAVAAGHHVTAFVRTPGSHPDRSANIRIVSGDATEAGR